MIPIPLIWFGVITGLDRILSMLPFNGKKTKIGVAMFAILQLFPGLGQYLTPDLIDALDKIAFVFMGLGQSHSIVKDEALKARINPRFRRLRNK